jgi:hypothetical protein
MGTYDVLLANAPCPWCGHDQPWRVQYKYGFCRLNEKRVCDLILWTDPPNWANVQRDHGKNVGGLVRVAGDTEHPCAQCGKREMQAILTIENNRIKAVTISREIADLGPEGYIQIDPMTSSRGDLG